jgi:PAS domain S-box-containing protein
VRLGHEYRAVGYAILAGVPGTIVAMILIWTGDLPPALRWPLTVLITLLWLVAALGVRHHVVHPLRTLSALLGALREGDYSVRGSTVVHNDAIGQVTREINTLADTLRHERMGAREATALLQKVMEEVDVAVVAFDAAGRLRLINRAGENLLGRKRGELLGTDAESVGLQSYLTGHARRLEEFSFPGGRGRWEVRRTRFRQEGMPHELLVLSDVSRTLREEERRAWQRIVRVLGHELNNSLTPISSISDSLITLLAQNPRPADWEDDVRHGLGVIASRSASLGRFVEAYSRLARLPRPALDQVDLGSLIRHVIEVERRLAVELQRGPDVTVVADRGQIEQLLINLVGNAVEAAMDTGGGVRVAWETRNGQVEILVDDDGPGLGETSNLFVPFFTTKAGGSGIGLALSRQIAEAHHGSLALENRSAGGCRARLSLPLVQTVVREPDAGEPDRHRPDGQKDSESPPEAATRPN